jgi:EAL domain-containing protein (putative c-di-GMP-specific phosphodiesterase class I)
MEEGPDETKIAVGPQATAGPVAEGLDRLPAINQTRVVQYAAQQLPAHAGRSGWSSAPIGDIECLMKKTMVRARRFIDDIEEGRFKILYQPVVGIKSNRVEYFESLTRFRDGESPLDMIQFAEQVGIIEYLDLAVCREVIGKIEHLLECGEAQAIGVNLSGRSMENEMFVERLISLLRRKLAVSRFLLIEITETFGISDLIRANAIIQCIRAMGFRVCLDDFGSGAASFQYLRDLSVDAVKIDGAYIRKLGHSARDDAMLRGVVGTCLDIGVGIIGEHVETRQQSQRLAGLGVHFGQGWYYGAPTVDLDWPPNPGSR